MSLHQCFSSWIIYFWAQVFSSSLTTRKKRCYERCFFNEFPNDDVLVNILSRLSIEHVSICRRVSKKWLELTLTPDFAYIHLLQRKRTSNNNVLFLQCHNPREADGDGFFMFKESAKGKKMFERMKVPLNVDLSRSDGGITPSPVLYGSCNGLLVFTMLSNNVDTSCYILNPTTHERLYIMCKGARVCGFFFDPLSREHKLLCQRQILDIGSYRAIIFLEYYLFILEKELLREIGTFRCSPLCIRNPILLNKCLHWISSDGACKDFIMVYNTETEFFDSIPHPGNHCFSGGYCSKKRANTCLVEQTRELWLCHMHEDHSIDVWVLKDYEARNWVKRYAVNLDWDFRLYPRTEDYKGDTRILCVGNGEMLICRKFRGLFWYDLEEDSVRNIDMRGTRLQKKLKSERYYEPCYRQLYATSYIKSLVSFKVPLRYKKSGMFYSSGVITIDLV